MHIYNFKTDLHDKRNTRCRTFLALFVETHTSVNPQQKSTLSMQVRSTFKYLQRRHLTTQLLFSACTPGRSVQSNAWSRRSQQAGPLHRTWERLEATRLEDAWFLYQLVAWRVEQSMSRISPQEIDETLRVNSQMGTSWVRCSRLQTSTIDGNEKLNRAMCAAPKNLVQLAGKFCKSHQDLDRSSKWFRCISQQNSRIVVSTGSPVLECGNFQLPFSHQQIRTVTRRLVVLCSYVVIISLHRC